MRLVHGFRARPRLLTALVAGLIAGACLSLVPNPLAAGTRAIMAWDFGCACFVVLAVRMMSGADGAAIAQHAATQDEGRHIILGLVLFATAASLITVGVELSAAKAAHGLERSIRVGLAFGTVAISWFMVQMIFALHYAYEYYRVWPDEEGYGGLGFPGGEEPDYWDFVHFSVIIGVACQTADISFTQKRLRRIGTLHGVVAFVFNTGVLALTVNLVAGLF